MFYPLVVLQHDLQIYPLFGQALKGEPFILDLSIETVGPDRFATTDYPSFQREIFSLLEEAGASWGIGPYLENRGGLLAQYPGMVSEKRFFHAGLDIIVPPGLPLFAPLGGVVHATEVDGGTGNYGGLVVIKHQIAGAIFYSLYGHLSTQFEVEPGEPLIAGQRFGTIGEDEDSGGWFTHTHLQILTEPAMAEGLMFKGYVSAEDLPRIDTLFPSPYPLFRY